LIKVVLDTNVYISSIFWEGGNPHKIVEKAMDGKISVYISKQIVEELERVLRADFKEPEEAVQRQVNLIIRYARSVEPREKIPIVKEDPEDNKIIECGVCCRAEYIITGDKHLLRLKEFRGIKIVSPKEFIDILS